MSRLKFDDLKKGKIYVDRDYVSAFKFVGMYNDCLAEFFEMEYVDEKGDFIKTDISRLFNKFEIADLIEC